MNVPSYQMHNVLNVYCRQLKQNMASDGRTRRPSKPTADQVDQTTEEKRRATIEKVSQDILDKITRYGSRKDNQQQIVESLQIPSAKKPMPHSAVNETFVFNAIDTINQKSKNSISVDDSSFLLQRLEQLARQRAEKGRNP